MLQCSKTFVPFCFPYIQLCFGVCACCSVAKSTVFFPRNWGNVSLTIWSGLLHRPGNPLSRHASSRGNRIDCYTGRPVTAQPDLTGQWHLFSYTQRHYPILPCKCQAPGRLRCLKQSDRVKSFPCAALGARG